MLSGAFVTKEKQQEAAPKGAAAGKREFIERRKMFLFSFFYLVVVDTGFNWRTWIRSVAADFLAAVNNT